MWTKEPPKEPGFYWFRYPQMVPVNRDDNPTIVRVMGSMCGGPLTCAFPGNEDCPQLFSASLLAGGPEWWSEPMFPPSGPHFDLQAFDPCAFPTLVAYREVERANGANPERLEALANLINDFEKVFNLSGFQLREIDSGFQLREIEIGPQGKAEAQRAAGLRTIAKPGEPGYKANAPPCQHQNRNGAGACLDCGRDVRTPSGDRGAAP